MKRSKWIPASSVAVMCVSLAACGGNDGNPTSASLPPLPTAPPAPVTAVVSQGSFGGLSAFSGVSTPAFTTTAVGRLDVSVDWTFASNDVDIFLVRGAASCGPAQFNARLCEIVASSVSVTTKPERVSVPSLAAGPYTVLFINWGPDSESLSYQALLTTGGTATAAIRPTSVRSSKADTFKLQVR